ISVDIPEEARFVLADAGKCKQVLLNLVKNGVEALEGPGEVRVTASLEHSDGIRRVRVAVGDTGRGIPEQALARITEPFYSDKEGGTGLGLAIVDRMLQLHGTQLEATSRPGHGTCMTFVLPAAADMEEG
ncbi:MAG: sensor histidine kinase, partial [Planctomycetota bacterium]